MSSILRALKKLEHEKASRKQEPVEVDVDFLQNAPPPRRSLLKGILTVAFLIASGGAATYFLLPHHKTVETPAKATVVPAVSQIPVILPRLSSVRPLAAVQANRSSLVPPNLTSAPATPPPPAISPPATVKTPPAKQLPITKQLSPPPPPVKKQKPVVDTTYEPTTFPSLTVNGIVLSDGENRKAVVNNVAVSKGSVIRGVKVEDVLENRVQFSYKGKTFELSIGETGP